MSVCTPEEAVKEDRAIPRGEEHVRKLILPLSCLGVAIYVAKKGGPKNSAPAAVSGWLSMGISFFVSGLYKTCGCTFRGNWRIHQKVGGTVAKTPAPEHKPFVQRKRRQLIKSVAIGAAAGTLISCGVFGAAGALSLKVALGCCKGAFCYMVPGMFIASAAYPSKK